MRNWYLGLLAAGVMLLAPRGAIAATLFLSPPGGQYASERVFPVTVRVNTQGTAINAAQGTLSFNPAVLQVVSLSTTGSLFDSHVEHPSFSNTDGTVRWGGVIFNPGFTGTSGNLLTVTFRSMSPGRGAVNFESGAVLANDGEGTNVLSGMTGALYSIGAGTTTASPAPQPPGLAPGADSPTLPETGSGVGDGPAGRTLLLLLALLAGLALVAAAWRRRHRAMVFSGDTGGDEQKVSDTLAHIARDMDEEIALLGGIAKNRPLYPEETYLRSKLLRYRRTMKLLMTDTHKRLAKRK